MQADLGTTRSRPLFGSFASVNLIDRLGYAIPEPNRLQRLVQSVASSRPGAATLSRVLMPIDKLVGHISGSRTSLPRILAGLPVVALTTVGRRSGRERQVVLVAVPFRDTLTLIGTNWGRPETPNWVFNLEAQPLARIEYGGVSCSVEVRAVVGTDWSRAMEVAAGHYPGYLEYQRRITGRTIRVFSLHPIDG